VTLELIRHMNERFPKVSVLRLHEQKMRHDNPFGDRGAGMPDVGSSDAVASWELYRQMDLRNALLKSCENKNANPTPGSWGSTTEDLSWELTFTSPVAVVHEGAACKRAVEGFGEAHRVNLQQIMRSGSSLVASAWRQRFAVLKWGPGTSWSYDLLPGAWRAVVMVLFLAKRFDRNSFAHRMDVNIIKLIIGLADDWQNFSPMNPL
jgi:hypothetical protein